jgi:hypothetical protein
VDQAGIVAVKVILQREVQIVQVNHILALLDQAVNLIPAHLQVEVLAALRVIRQAVALAVLVAQKVLVQAAGAAVVEAAGVKDNEKPYSNTIVFFYDYFIQSKF